jgi:hypothetical protein
MHLNHQTLFISPIPLLFLLLWITGITSISWFDHVILPLESLILATTYRYSDIDQHISLILLLASTCSWMNRVFPSYSWSFIGILTCEIYYQIAEYNSNKRFIIIILIIILTPLITLHSSRIGYLIPLLLVTLWIQSIHSNNNQDSTTKFIVLSTISIWTISLLITGTLYWTSTLIVSMILIWKLFNITTIKFFPSTLNLIHYQVDEMVWMMVLRELIYPNPGMFIGDYSSWKSVWNSSLGIVNTIVIPFFSITFLILVGTRITRKQNSVATTSNNTGLNSSSTTTTSTKLIAIITLPLILQRIITNPTNNIVLIMTNFILLLSTLVIIILTYSNQNNQKSILGVIAIVIFLIIVLTLNVAGEQHHQVNFIQLLQNNNKPTTSWFKQNPSMDCIRSMSFFSPGYWNHDNVQTAFKSSLSKTQNIKTIPHVIDQYMFYPWSCSTTTTNTEVVAVVTRPNYWNKYQFIFVGDSVIRWLYYSLINRMRDSQYGFPPAKYHANLHYDELTSFIWAPFASDLLEYVRYNMSATTTTTTKPEQIIYIFGNGPWDMLHRRNPSIYIQEINEISHELLTKNLNRVNTKCIWIEFAKLDPSKMLSLQQSNKQLHLTEDKAKPFRSIGTVRFNELGCLILPLHTMTLDRESRDGVHYSAIEYEAAIGVMERMLMYVL